MASLFSFLAVSYAGPAASPTASNQVGRQL